MRRPLASQRALSRLVCRKDFLRENRLAQAGRWRVRRQQPFVARSQPVAAGGWVG